MWLKFLLSIFISLSVAANNIAQTDIQSFWKKFQKSVVSRNKIAVAEMTKFPLSMPYGVKTVKNRADFIKRYDEIMDFEADSKRCFASQKIEKDENSKLYFVNCTFKSEPETSEDRPILYYFEKTKTGWKFVSLDNINE
jgi:hypothetical protein